MATFVEQAALQPDLATTPLRNSDAWVIVPALNEASVIGEVLADLRAHFPHIVVVDDGSDDSTGDVAQKAGVHLVRHPENLGMGAALQTGVDFALLDRDARYFVTFDADGQHSATDAAAMVSRLRQEDVDVVLGSRFLGEHVDLPRGRRALLQTARAFERLSTGLRITDAHNGLRAFSRSFAEQLNLTLADMAHASEVLRRVARTGVAYTEHPVTIRYSDYSRRKGQRSINSVNIVVDVWLHQLLRSER